MDIEARTRVADTLAALLATHEELEIELGPERWTRFLEDLDAWMEDSRGRGPTTSGTACAST